MNNSKKSEDFILIIWVWETLINFLSKLSIFNLVRKGSKLNKRNPYLFVDIWILSHTLLSILAIVIVKFIQYKPILYIILFYGFFRVFEIFIYQIKVCLVDSYKENANVKSYRRMVFALIHNFIEIIFWFTASYLLLMSWFKVDYIESNTNLTQALYMSFVTMTTFGPPNFNISNNYAIVLIMIQSIVGLLMTMLSLARFISLLPRPKSQNLIEEEAHAISNQVNNQDKNIHITNL